MEERDGNPVDVTRAVPAQTPDGDDIQVMPGGIGDPPRGPRNRRIIVGSTIAAALVLAVAIILANRSGSSAPVVKTTTPTTLTGLPPAVIGSPKTVPVKVTVPVGAATTVAASKPIVVVTSPGGSATVPTTVFVAPTAPPTSVAAPKQYGPSVLQWAAPFGITIASGKTGSLAVTAHNPTSGIVTLPHPLSCTPRIDHSEMCTETVQQIGPTQSASATYTIDATGIAAGHYTLKIEGVLTVPVTVS